MYEPNLSLKTKRYARRQHLIRAGAGCDAMFRINEGLACSYHLLADGKRQITRLFLPGDYCEPQWFLTGRSSSPILTLSQLSAERISFTDIHRCNGVNVKDVLAALLQNFERQTKWLVLLARGPAIDRIVTLLTELYERLARDEARVLIPLTQSEIADIVGLTSIHVNRMLRELAIKNLVVIQGRRLYVSREIRDIKVSGK